MSDPVEVGEHGQLSPEEAFAVLGNETRIRILQVLGEADGALSFSDLYDRIDYDPSTNFSYHLRKLDGHFVRKTDDGYEISQVGNRVVQAVYSGTVTDAPLLGRTPVDHRCEYCGAKTEISFTKGYVGLYCTECPGTTDDSVPPEYHGYLRGQPFPPAGLQDRDPEDVHRAAFVWGNLQRLSLASQICPICSAHLDHVIDVCDDHHPNGSLCETCGRRRMVSVRTVCANCKIEGGGPLRTFLLAETELLAFLTTHGLNPLEPSTEPWVGLETYDEEVMSMEPLVLRVTFAIDDDTISLLVDESLTVKNVTSDHAQE